jgi:hypothetical protein
MFTVANAFVSPTMFVALVAIFDGPVMNPDSAHTEATVVTSLIETDVDELRFPHGPSAVISARFGLLPLALRPGSPPVATRYTSVDALGHV